jgi:hypothetical protein
MSGRWDGWLCVAQAYRCNALEQFDQEATSRLVESLQLKRLIYHNLCLSTFDFLTPQCASLAVVGNPGRGDRYHRNLHHMMYKLPSQYTCTACTHRLYVVIPHLNLHTSTLYPQHCLAVITGHTHTTIAGLTCSRSLLEGAMSLHISTFFPHTHISTSQSSLTISCHVSESTRLDQGKRGLVRALLRR